jgi:large subunit ribosomal protein L18
MKKTKTPAAARIRRHRRVRRRLAGTPDRPRLAVFRSISHIYAQVIDDSSGRTLVAASDLESDLRSLRDGKKKAQVAMLVGEALADKAAKMGIKTVVFDRGGFKYHGRIKALAEAARKGGLSLRR